MFLFYFTSFSVIQRFCFIRCKMYDKQKLLEILLDADFQIIQNNGRPYPPSTEIYRTISEKMKEFNNNITSKYIYIRYN